MTIEKSERNVNSRKDEEQYQDFHRIMFEMEKRKLNGHDPAPPSLPAIEPGGIELWSARAIPPRDFLYGDHYIRKYVSITAGAGGTGKSALAVVEALAMVTAQPLLNVRPRRPRKVWYIGEDDEMELRRRFAAAIRRYAIKPYGLEWLLIDSFRNLDLVICDGIEGPDSLAWQRRQQIIAVVRKLHIDVIMLDPAHKTHLGMENDNVAMNQVLAAWVEVAEKGDCAIELLMHSRKVQPGVARTIDDARGASSQVDAARHARYLVKMTDDEAEQAGVEKEDRFRYVRFADAKVNMSEPEPAMWYRLDSIFLGNEIDGVYPSDNVQVISVYDMEKPLDGVEWPQIRAIMANIREGLFKKSSAANDWAGIMMMRELKLEDTKAVRKRMGRIISNWLKSGWLTLELKRDPVRRRDGWFLAVGNYEEGF